MNLVTSLRITGYKWKGREVSRANLVPRVHCALKIAAGRAVFGQGYTVWFSVK